MTDAEKLAVRDRLAFLTIRLHALMKKRWREELAGFDRERLLHIAAAKIHESRVLSQQLYELTGFKERYGGNFSTAAFEVGAIRNTAFSDGEILALGAQAEVRSQNSTTAAKVKAEKKAAILKAALAEYSSSTSLKKLSAHGAALSLVAKRDDSDKPKYDIKVGTLERRISDAKPKK